VAQDASAFLPAERSLTSLREAASRCMGCDLYKSATQTVFGVGSEKARVVMVVEQPGDREDLTGVPFVGPAGRMLDEALATVGVDRGKVYITNAVKHFKWVPRGKRRIHETPRASEIRACKPWLESELDLIRPRLVVALGATAVGSLLGPTVRVLQRRGEVLESVYGPCLVTVHPSSLLRFEGEEERKQAYDAFVNDLKQGVEFLNRLPAA
jgi:uracil-DNA glycosylase